MYSFIDRLEIEHDFPNNVTRRKANNNNNNNNLSFTSFARRNRIAFRVRDNLSSRFSISNNNANPARARQNDPTEPARVVVIGPICSYSVSATYPRRVLSDLFSRIGHWRINSSHFQFRSRGK